MAEQAEDDYEGDYFQDEVEDAFSSRVRIPRESAFDKNLRLQRKKDDEEQEKIDAEKGAKDSRINYSALDDFLGTTFTKQTPLAITTGKVDFLTDAEKEYIKPKSKRTLKYAPNVKKGSIRAKDRRRQKQEVKEKPPVWKNPAWEKAHKELQQEFAPLGGERPPMSQKELKEFKKVGSDEPSIPTPKQEKIVYNITDEDIFTFADLGIKKSGSVSTDYDEDTDEEIDDPLIPEISKFDRPPPLVLPEELDVFDPDLVDSPLGDSPPPLTNYNPQLADYRAFKDPTIPDIQQRFIDSSYDKGVNPFAPDSPTWMGKDGTIPPAFDFPDPPERLPSPLRYEDIESPDYYERVADFENIPYRPPFYDSDINSPSPSPPPQSPPPSPKKSPPPSPKKSPSPEPRDDDRLARILEAERRRRKLVKERKAERKKEKADRRESPSPKPRSPSPQPRRERSPSPKGERDERSDKGEHHEWKDGRERTATYKKNKAKGVNWSEVRCRGGTCWDTIDRSSDYKGRGAYKKNKGTHYQRQLRGKDDNRKNN